MSDGSITQALSAKPPPVLTGRSIGARTLPVLISVLTASCMGTPHSDIEGEDHTFLGAVRASIPFEPNPDADPDDAQFGYRVEIDAAGGEFNQALLPGETVKLDDVVYTGPGDVAFDFDHKFVGLGLYGAKTSGRWRREGSVGVAGSFLNSRISMLGLTDSKSVDNLGFLLTGAFSYELSPRLRGLYELRLFQGVSGTDDVEIFASELGAQWMVSEALSLSGGYQGWQYTADRDEGFPEPSNLVLDLEGPFLRLGLRF